MLQFNIGENERDSDLNFIPASSIEVDVLDLSSVVQVNGATSTPLTTGVVVCRIIYLWICIWRTSF